LGRKYGKKLMKTTTDITCDICNKSCKDYLGNFEYALLEGDWGYTSNKDLEQHSCYMCENCYDKVRSFIESINGSVKINRPSF
jgi:hypothetical protein